MAAIAVMPATTGENTAGMITFCTSVPKCTALPPKATHVAPIRPPNRACDELDGRPRYQVNRFQTIAPTKAPNTMYGPEPAWNLVSSTMPLEMVLATFTDRNAPTTLRMPAIVTASFGLSAPVAMDVAIAFAVSWKPLVKSNASAVMTTT